MFPHLRTVAQRVQRWKLRENFCPQLVGVKAEVFAGVGRQRFHAGLLMG